MSKKTGYLLGMLLTIIICMILAYLFCCGGALGLPVIDDSLDKDREEVVEVPSPTALPFNLNDPDGNFAFNSDDNFNFESSKFTILTPLSEEVDTGILELHEYLDAEGNENKEIEIIGYYDEGEKNPSVYENIGLARANAIKNHFVDQGINSAQIDTYGKLKDSLVPDGDVYRGPVSYSIYTQAQEDKEEEEEQMSQVAEDIKEEPLTLYFDYGQATVTLTEQQRRKIGDINRYLDKVDGSTITIEGHTDDQGSDAKNNRLGEERANFAKAYLVSNGIAHSKIKTVSKGEKEPLDLNETEAGRAKNRRVVVTINQTIK